MPELPEVETIKKELENIAIGKKITEVIINNPKVIKEPSARLFKKKISGAVIKKILRKGKLLIFELSTGESLTIHLRMTGQLIYPGSAKKSRVSLRFSNAEFLDFMDQRLLGELRLVREWKDIKFIKALGPEPFEIDEEDFVNKLKLRKTKIKPLIMDQGFLSGVGNLYAAEALFKSRINPCLLAFKLSRKQAGELLAEIKSTLKQAIKFGGSSVDQYVRVSGNPGGYLKYHKVYNRKGKPCFICKTPIARIAIGGRGTYFCPRCQR